MINLGCSQQGTIANRLRKIQAHLTPPKVKENMPGKVLRVGVIGVGRIGRVHIESIQSIKDACVTMVADIWEDGARQVCEQYGIPKYVKDYKDLIADADVDAVLICSPTDQHASQIMEASRAGKAIFCEKPISLNLEIIDEVCNVVEETGALCMVAFQRRFDPTFKRLQTAVAKGEVGNVHMIAITSRDPGPPPVAYIAQSGGLHCDMAIHDFDMARFITGSDIVEVFTKGDCKIDPAIAEAGDIDTSLVVLKFANGVIGTISNSRKATYGYDQRVEVFGSKGMIQSENLRPNMCTISNAGSVHQDLPFNFFMDRYKEAYKVEMEEFVSCAIAGTKPPCGVAEGRAATKVAMAAAASMKANAPVAL
ncbi:hypothetical protein VYU27_001774 [Nannochloropsis oceanica]